MRALLRNGILAFAVLAAGASNVEAQYAWDYGIHLGGANYLGEFGGKEKTRQDFIWDLKLNQTRWCVGGFARRKINRLISINSGLLYMRLQGADENSTNPARVGRNLNFRNDMFEAYLRGEFTIFADNDLGGRGRYKTDFRLFGYVGAAAFFSTPKGQYRGESNATLSNGEWVSLQPIQTEQVDYGRIGMAIPVGVGFHFTKKRRHRFGWDFGWRTTFTDYIDDASTVYKYPFNDGDDNNDIRGLMYDQSDLVTHGTQYDTDPVGGLFTQDADNPGLPNEEQYGWEPETGGPSKKVENKRGDPTHNDSYLTMTFTYSYVLKGQSNFYKTRYNWMRGKKRVGRKSRAKF